MLTLQEVQSFVSRLDGWGFEGNSIVKLFYFTDFKQSLDFLNKVGEIAEKLGHYPDAVINQGNVRISLTTYAEKGLSKRDFEVAEEIDKI